MQSSGNNGSALSKFDTINQPFKFCLKNFLCVLFLREPLCLRVFAAIASYHKDESTVKHEYVFLIKN